MGKTARLYDHLSRSKQEVGVLDREISEEVNKWVGKVKDCANEYLAREQVLKLLIVEVSQERTPLQVIVQVVAKAHLSLELDSIVKQTRWLKQQKVSLVGLVDSRKLIAQR